MFCVSNPVREASQATSVSATASTRTRACGFCVPGCTRYVPASRLRADERAACTLGTFRTVRANLGTSVTASKDLAEMDESCGVHHMSRMAAMPVGSAIRASAATYSAKNFSVNLHLIARPGEIELQCADHGQKRDKIKGQQRNGKKHQTGFMLSQVGYSAIAMSESGAGTAQDADEFAESGSEWRGDAEMNRVGESRKASCA